MPRRRVEAERLVGMREKLDETVYMLVVAGKVDELFGVVNELVSVKEADGEAEEVTSSVLGLLLVAVVDDTLDSVL